MFKRIKRKIYIGIFLLLILVLTACDTPGANSNIDEGKSNIVDNITNQQWLEDIDYLQKELPKKHKNIYHTLKKEDFNKEISDLKNRISELEGYEIKYELSKIIANIGDAHTFLDPGFTQNEKLYPLITAWYGGELRVIGTHKKYKNFIGKELIGINNIPIEDIMKKSKLTNLP
ncbi:hypothetical protein [Dethiothermospora halolimnae]|uniref:hypothetical protein n=1 Tax=Dethiothermospora halolimnae TaxID=3114390 RepID=UPI003CCBD429